MKKIFFLFFCLVLLNNCAQNAALLGPTIAVGSTGNVYQASLSYGVNKSIEEETGKTPAQHVTEYVEVKGKEKKRRQMISNFLENHIKTTRQKLSLNN